MDRPGIIRRDQGFLQNPCGYLPHPSNGVTPGYIRFLQNPIWVLQGTLHICQYLNHCGNNKCNDGHQLDQDIE
jgi:hypothetical protein